MIITPAEWKRRKMVSAARVILTEAMGKVCDEVGELYYSEWLSLFNEQQQRLISDLLRDDWKGAKKK